jgi:hypothetical protein
MKSKKLKVRGQRSRSIRSTTPRVDDVSGSTVARATDASMVAAMRPVLLAIQVGIIRDGLFLRQGIATATLPDGATVEICANLSGGDILVTFQETGASHWKTYVLTPTAIVTAVLAIERP